MTTRARLLFICEKCETHPIAVFDVPHGSSFAAECPDASDPNVHDMRLVSMGGKLDELEIPSAEETLASLPK